MNRCLSCLLAVLLGVASGCAEAPLAFSTRFPDNRPQDVAAMMAALEAAPKRAPLNVAVGVTPPPTRMYGVDLSSHRVLWQQATRLEGAPMLAGTVVLNQDGDRIIGRALTSGTLRFAVPAGGMRLQGADGDAQSVVLVVSKGAFAAARSEVILIRDGSVAWRRPLPYQAGAPAVLGEVVLVPWGHQHLSGLHRNTGREIARLRVLDRVISQAFVYEGRAYAGGEEGVAQVTAGLAGGAMRDAAFIPAPEARLPGRPAFLRDVYSDDGVISANSAAHSIRLAWNPGTGTQVAGDTLYLVFYRFVTALHYPSLSLRWMHVHDCDLVGAQAAPSGLLFADRKGTFGRLDVRSGQPLSTRATDLPTTAVILPRSIPWTAGTAPEAAPPDVRRQLRAAAEDPDARLVPMRRYAVERLAMLPEAEATRDLLALCGDRRLAPAVRDDACDALPQRTLGREALIGALDQHYNYLTDTPAPPVGALARALRALGETRAFPALVEHLRDPHTPSRALPDLVRAIAGLSPDQAATPLAEFARRYHSDPVDEHVIEAVEQAIESLYGMRGPIAAETLIELAEDRLGLRGIQRKAGILLAQLEEASRAASQPKESDSADLKAKSTRSVARPEPPERLTFALVEDILQPVRRELRQCLAESEGNVFHGRMVLVVEDGEVLMVSVTPKALQACVESVVRTRPFPRTQLAGRQQISYPLDRK